MELYGFDAKKNDSAAWTRPDTDVSEGQTRDSIVMSDYSAEQRVTKYRCCFILDTLQTEKKDCVCVCVCVCVYMRVQLLLACLGRDGVAP